MWNAFTNLLSGLGSGLGNVGAGLGNFLGGLGGNQGLDIGNALSGYGDMIPKSDVAGLLGNLGNQNQGGGIFGDLGQLGQLGLGYMAMNEQKGMNKFSKEMQNKQYNLLLNEINRLKQSYNTQLEDKWNTRRAAVNAQGESYIPDWYAESTESYMNRNRMT